MMAMASSKKPSRKKSKRVASHTVHVGTRSKLLSNLTDECLNSYFENLNGHKPGDFPKAEAAYERLISLPMFHGMMDSDADDVIRAVGKVLAHYAK